MDEKIYIKTGKPEFDKLYPMVKSFLEKDTLDIVIDGQEIRGYRTPDAKSIWIRDYSDMMRGFKYFEHDLKSTIDHFAETQADNGRLFDYFTIFPEKLPSERENWTKYVRVPVEADVEYRFIKAIYLAWQAEGDDDWLENLLPKMEKALNYIMTHPWRWEKNLGLVKRAYTIDTWDFAYTAGEHEWLQFQIDDNTFWGIMHCDNSGYYEAFEIMSNVYDYFGRSAETKLWNTRALELKNAMKKTCWNGSFFTHFVKLNDVDIPGVDESKQLSLSSPMAINRGTTDTEMARSIIDEYIDRGKTNGAFAEWYSIDPPYPDGVFGDDKLIGGAYVNGGIMPLVGGELAKAAFDNGYERYGISILRKYYDMISEKGETYLWYFPDGTPASVETSTSPDAEPTDGWGSSAMAYALIEGLAGIEDQFKLYEKVKLSPRWASAEISTAEVCTGYEVSEKYFYYKFDLDEEKIVLNIKANNAEIDFHVLLPGNSTVKKVSLDGRESGFKDVKIGESNYADFSAKVQENTKVIINIKSD